MFGPRRNIDMIYNKYRTTIRNSTPSRTGGNRGGNKWAQENPGHHDLPQAGAKGFHRATAPTFSVTLHMLSMHLLQEKYNHPWKKVKRAFIKNIKILKERLYGLYPSVPTTWFWDSKHFLARSESHLCCGLSLICREEMIVNVLGMRPWQY